MSQFGSEYFKLSPDLICVFDLDGNFVELNPAWKKTLGWDLDHFIQTPLINFIHPDDKEISMEEFRKLFQGAQETVGFENRILHKDGRYLWLQWSASVIEGDKQIFCVARDITSIKRDAILFQETQEVSRVGSWEIDLTSMNLHWSTMTHQIHETDPLHYKPKLEDGLSYFAEESRHIIESCVEKLLKTGLGYDIEIPFVTARGRQTWVRCVSHAKMRDGVVISVFGTIEDILDKKNRNQEKISREIVFEKIVNNIPIMLTFFNPDGSIEWINSYWTEVLGWTIDDLKDGGIFGKTLYPTQNEQVDAIKFIIDSSHEWREFALLRKDGHINHTIWTTVRMENGMIIGIGQDIDEKKMQEIVILDQQERMLNSAKLSSLGEMAGGIAHEINNPLAIIKGKAHQILRRLEDPVIDVEFIKKELGKIDQNSQRIVKIIKGLKTFSRQGDEDPYESITFKSLIDDVSELFIERFKHQGVELRLSGDQNTELFCKPVQISQVLLNLINNAHDAVCKDASPWVEISIEVINNTTCMYVTDSGTGISEELAQKIMQPFFTTKDVGTGTGLGLSISKGIIERHGGALFLDRFSPNTKFVIQLPTKNNICKIVEDPSSDI